MAEDEKKVESEAGTEPLSTPATTPAADPLSPESTTSAAVESSDSDKEAEPKVAAEEADLASPDAIARRVAALGEEDESEKLARREEEKLAERRARTQGKKPGKRGLEASASKKLAKIGEKSEKSRGPAPVRAVPADPLLQKTNELGRWAKANRGLVGGVVAAIVVVGAGFFVKEYFAQRTENHASELLANAVEDQRGRLGEDNPEEAEGFQDPSPIFKTAVERREAALTKYREVQNKFPKTGAAYLARLSEGSLLLDKREADAAAAAFTDVKGSPLAVADAEVRGRALEGLGFAYELKAQGGDKAKLDDAAKAFRELENTDIRGFKELGMYHQARVAEAKGENDKAKELLKSLRERVNKPGEGHPFPYLESVADDRLRALDPTALPPKAPNVSGGAPGNKMSEAQMRKMIEQMQKQMKEAGDKGGHGGGAAPH